MMRENQRSSVFEFLPSYGRSQQTSAQGEWKILPLRAGLPHTESSGHFKIEHRKMGEIMTTEREVTFKSGPFTLAGTLQLPSAGGPWPAVLLVPGSGRIDRDENAPKLRINAFHDIAAHLATQGVASLRYDKQGMGASEGSFWDAGLFDNVADASAALNWLKAQPEIRPDKVFLLGHSEGAIISTRLGGTGTDVAGIILLAGPARNGEDVLAGQAEQMLKCVRGLNKWLIKLFRINVRKSQQKQLDKIKASTKNWYRFRLVVKINAKWFREFMAYNPAQEMPKIQAPVLALTGAKDIQVDPTDLDVMAGLIKAQFESHVLPDITHLLRSEPGAPTFFNYKQQLKQPVAPIVLHATSDWLRKKIPLTSG
jgi:pimeloyl-ACP methyl ester carboxylesterase